MSWTAQPWHSFPTLGRRTWKTPPECLPTRAEPAAPSIHHYFSFCPFFTAFVCEITSLFGHFFLNGVGMILKKRLCSIQMFSWGFFERTCVGEAKWIIRGDARGRWVAVTYIFGAAGVLRVQPRRALVQKIALVNYFAEINSFRLSKAHQIPSTGKIYTPEPLT